MDQHLHTLFSLDGQDPMDKVCARAAKLGMSHICFTEHVDYGYPGTDQFLVDYNAYHQEIERCRAKHPELFIGMGLEAGALAETAHMTAADIAKYDLDFIIASLHVVAGVDPYYPAFYEGRSRKQCLALYVEALVEMVGLLPDYDVMGHIGYVTKFAPFSDRPLTYLEFPDELDVVLRHLAQHGRGLEVNTSGYRDSSYPFPSPCILKRFKALGGEIVTLGSDAHEAGRVGKDFDKGLAVIRDAGFNRIALFKKRKPEFVSI